MRTFGIMQGRLSPPEDGRFQAFPRKGWRDEFARARAAGLDHIEWIHDAYGEAKDQTGRIANPIFSEAGLAEFDALKQEHHIAIPALCGDWFMDVPLIRCSPAERVRREKHLHDLIPIAARIGAKRIVLPFVDNSKMNGEYEKQTVIEILKRALPVAEQHGVELHLEADFNPQEFAAFLARIPHPMLKVNWDSGNSSGLGYVATASVRYTSRTVTGNLRAVLKRGRSVRARPTLTMCFARSNRLGMRAGSRFRWRVASTATKSTLFATNWPSSSDTGRRMPITSADLQRDGLFSLEGKTAVLTGASGFLGRTFALALLANGARVVALGRSERLLTEAAGWANEFGEDKISVRQIDMYDTAALDDLCDAIAAEEKSIDVLINNAHELGAATGFNVPEGSLENSSFDQWQR